MSDDIISIAVQPAPRWYRDGNSLRTTMHRKRDTLGSMWDASRGQRGRFLRALGSDATCIQGFEVFFRSLVTLRFLFRKFKWSHESHLDLELKCPRSNLSRSTGWMGPVRGTFRPKKTLPPWSRTWLSINWTWLSRNISWKDSADCAPIESRPMPWDVNWRWKIFGRCCRRMNIWWRFYTKTRTCFRSQSARVERFMRSSTSGQSRHLRRYWPCPTRNPSGLKD